MALVRDRDSGIFHCVQWMTKSESREDNTTVAVSCGVAGEDMDVREVRYTKGRRSSRRAIKRVREIDNSVSFCHPQLKYKGHLSTKEQLSLSLLHI